MELNRILVTPEMANDYLKANSGNRNIRESVVRAYAADMKNGTWYQKDGLVNPVSFSKTGRLIDGQHRLHAIIRSGVPIWCYVVTGAEEDAFYYFDGGEKRRLSDQINSPNAANAAAVSKKMAAFSIGSPIGRAINGLTAGRTITRIEARQFYSENVELIEDACVKARQMYRACNAVTNSVYGSFCAFVVWLGIDDHLSEFVDDYSATSSASQQTQFVKMTFFKKKSSKGEGLTMTQKFTFLLMAYEKYRKDEELLTFNKVSRYMENFNEAIKRKAGELKR